MLDINAPKTSLTVTKDGKLTITAIDEELPPDVAGAYQGYGFPGNHEYYIVIEANSNKEKFQGWLVKKDWYGKVLPINSSIVYFVGELNWRNNNIDGFAQTISDTNNIISKDKISGEYSEDFIKLAFGSLIIELQGKITNIPIKKPDFRK